MNPDPLILRPLWLEMKERPISFYMELKPLEGVDVFAWFTQPLFFLILPLGREQGQKGRKTHGEIAEDIDKLSPLNTSVAPLTLAFPVSGIALGFQQCYSAENGLLEFQDPQEKQGKHESPKKVGWWRWWIEYA